MTPQEESAPGPRPCRFEGQGGIRLAADAWGSDSAPPVLMFHGGGQTRSSWDRTAALLAAEGWQVYSFDLRGHGDSDWPDDADYRLDAFAADVDALARQFSAPPVLVGASLGGQAVLTAVGESDEPLAAGVVLVDIATRMEAEGFERIVGFLRRFVDGFETLEEAADAIAAYRGKPRPKDLSGLAKNLRTGPDGRLRWHWDPRFVTDNREVDRTESEARLEDATRALQVPTLLVRGAVSDLLSEEGAQRFLSLAPHARFADVTGAGHMVAGDNNDPFTEAVRKFLSEVPVAEGRRLSAS